MLLGKTLECHGIKRLHSQLKITPEMKLQGNGGSLPHYVPAPEGKISFSIIDESRDELVDGVEILLVSEDDKPKVSYINPFPKLPKFPLPEQSSSDQSISFIKTWLSFCRKYHDLCNASEGLDKYLPTRLVDIGDLNCQRGPRVIVTATGNIGDSQYLCLSHRWIDMGVRLESTNIHELEQSIPVQGVSQTFRDTFTTTRRLGFRYIWIDSLCIMQDHKTDAGWQDWLSESTKMGDYYKHAVLTIAPTPVVDGCDEFFFSRDMQRRSPLAVEIKRKVPTDMSWSACIPTQIDVSGLYYCFSSKVWSATVYDAPLNLRGWVYQERLLSPRTAHFASEIYWECRLLTASEMMPMGFPGWSLTDLAQKYFSTRASEISKVSEISRVSRVSKISRVFRVSRVSKIWTDMPRFLGTGFVDKYGAWKTCVQNFSQCALTMERDKLPAVSGIARELQFPDDQYLAGLWRNGLISQLTWQRIEGSLKVNETLKKYRAPSWSWASINGEVEFITSDYHIDEKSCYTATVEDCSVNLQTNDPFGQVTGGRLRLRTNLLQISSQSILTNSTWSLSFDHDEESFLNAIHYWCVPIAHVSWCNAMYMLLLAPGGTDDMEFRRIGLLSVNSGMKMALTVLKSHPDTIVCIV